MRSSAGALLSSYKNSFGQYDSRDVLSFRTIIWRKSHTVFAGICCKTFEKINEIRDATMRVPEPFIIGSQRADIDNMERCI